MGKKLKKLGLILCATTLLITNSTFLQKIDFALATASEKGFHIEGTRLCDANDNEFIMRGINHAHAWWKGHEEESIEAIAKTGSNTVRIALGDGDTWGYDNINTVENIISLCEKNNLVAVLEVHDATGLDDYSKLDKAVNYWINMKDLLNEHKSTVIINIANEWYGTWDSKGWANGYKKAIPKLRNSGIENTIMVDCAGWGQYPKSLADYAKEVFNSDEDENTMFSIHMYEYSGGDAKTVKNNIDSVINQDLALCIGEFGISHTNGDVDEQTIMDYCEEKSVSYLGWSWYGNGSQWKMLDIAKDWKGTSLSEWGNILINGRNGIKETSKICSIYKNEDIKDDEKPDIKDDEKPDIKDDETSKEEYKKTIEAESGKLVGVNIRNNRKGYSGEGYVTDFNNSNDSVELEVDVSKSADYYINIRYASQYDDKITDMYVNGMKFASVKLKKSQDFTDAGVDNVYLQEGKNTIKIVSNWGYYDLDALTITQI